MNALLQTLPPWAYALILAANLLAGYGVGRLYFLALWRSARGFTAGGSIIVLVALSVGRLAVIGTALTLASFEGALPLLSAAGGVLIARAVALRRSRQGVT